MASTVVLIGMPGSGKSLVGRLVAERLGWPFLDTDELIVRRTGRTVGELLQQDGEATFRDVERAAVREAAATTLAVIATGGGAVLRPDNMRLLRRGSVVISLDVPPDVLAGRVGADGNRPLLGSDPAAGVRRLLAERRPLYREADLILDASGPSAQVADQLVSALAARARETIMVQAGRHAYPVHIGSGNLDLLAWEFKEQLEATDAVLLTHPRLRRRFGARIEQILGAAGVRVLTLSLPEGERSKSLRRVAGVYDSMAAAGIGRDGVVLGLGGGVIGDLSGFVAGTYMRGLRLVHVPTTLLAQVDSAIGGKTAVNHPRAKNLIGVFHQPSLVVADVETLRSLPLRALRSGLAEVIKYGMVCDAGLLAFLEDQLDALLGWDLEALRRCVRWCVEVKARLVRADERDRGERQLLNYGHTVGHALEILSDGALTHGEAIAIGMSVEARLAHRLGVVEDATIRRQEAVLARAGLPVHLPSDAPDADAVLATMRLDKKGRGGDLIFALVSEPGRGLIDQIVPDALIRETLVACCASS